jgi:hypothetical protein
MRAVIIAAVQSLNDDEIEVVHDVVQGLVTGRKVYGPLVISVDARDFRAERDAEIRDGLVYCAILAIKQRRRGQGQTS